MSFTCTLCTLIPLCTLILDVSTFHNSTFRLQQQIVSSIVSQVWNKLCIRNLHVNYRLCQLGLEMRSQYINMSCSFSTSMKSNCSFSSVLKTNSSFSTVLKTHTYFIPLTPPFGSIFGGGGGMSITGFIANEDFGPPPLSDRFCKKSEKIRISSEWPETARNRKKIAPWWPPPRKKLRKREKNSKIFFFIFFSYNRKKLKKFWIFFLKIFRKLFRIIRNVKKTRKIIFHFKNFLKIFRL